MSEKASQASTEAPSILRNGLTPRRSHEATVRGATRPERNMLRTIGGDFTQLDRGTWTTLSAVLAG
jgi:hypothetical protein